MELQLPEPLSYWLATSPPPALAAPSELPPLDGLGGELDVAVVGGGIAGVTIAYLLSEAGQRVALVEAGRLLSGVTGNTTAKVSVQHRLIYADLQDRFGAGTAAGYGASQLAALEWLRAERARLGVDCDWSDRDSYVYVEDPGEVDRLRREAEVAAELGLPATYVDEVDLPFKVAGAVRFAEQAQFHPVRWLRALVARLRAGGGFVVEQTRVTGFDKGRLTTTRGELRARDVVIATHFPILDRGFYFARMAPVRELVVAGPGRAPEGMYIAADTGHSVRGVSLDDGRDLVIVLGEHYRPGTMTDVSEHHHALAKWAVERFDLSSIDYRWSAQDNTTVDRLPYIGRYTRHSQHLWVATGFGQWGMTNGTLAGLILRDVITGVDNPWAQLYDPGRTNLRQSATSFVRDNAIVAKHFVRDRLAALANASPDLAELANGEATIGAVGGRLAALRRDHDGQVTALSARCTHLGCAVAFNDDEQTWDCPCHGSRFGLDGAVVQGPATEPLRRLDLPGGAAT